MSEEQQGREEAVDAQLHIFRAMLPIWLKQLFGLDDPRQAKKIKHKLTVVDVDALPTAHLALIKRFIRGKKFQRYLIQNCHPISIDGTQKLVRDGQWWAEEWLDRSGAT